MKKACLITCHNIKNYGSVFQTYATTIIFTEYGYDIEVIDYQRPGTDKKGFREKVLKESHMAKKPIIGLIFPFVLFLSFRKMEQTFDSFLKKYVKLTPVTYLTEDELSANCPKADLYISGSDQIWNSDINGRIERPYYLTFLKDNIKRISFASSFGKSKLREEEKEINKDLLSKYSWLTTREDAGVRIINELGLEAESVLDPTLWLDREQWEDISEFIKVPDKYILVYQLHNNKEMDDYVRKLEDAYNMTCLRIDLYYHYIVKSGKHVVCPTPGQVISLVKKAKYVVTDSFHMTVFSIIFNKKFLSIYSSNSFNGRISNILNLLSLSSRNLKSYDDTDSLDIEIDYMMVNNELEKIKNRCRNRLKEVLHFLN